MTNNTIKVPKLLTPTNEEGIITNADAIWDKTINKRQSYINSLSIKGGMKVVYLEEDIAVDENPEINTLIDVIYVNNTSNSYIVSVSTEKYKTPDGQILVITVPAGGYGEVNFLNIDNVIFARGV